MFTSSPRIIQILLCTSAFFFSLSSLHAWGATGHRTVAEIGQKHLNPYVAKQVTKILKGRTMAMAAVWCDDIRDDPKWFLAEAWHWVTIEDGKTYEEMDKNPNGDIYEAILRFRKELLDPKTSELKREQALKWIIHLIGDLHQPLHVGRAADQGGNLVKVEWFGDDTTLHMVWDEHLIDHQRLSYTEFATHLNFVTVEQIQEMQNSTVKDWMMESMTYRKSVYNITENLTYKYNAQNRGIVKKRLLQAGIRLAGFLNDALGRKGK